MQSVLACVAIPLFLRIIYAVFVDGEDSKRMLRIIFTLKYYRCSALNHLLYAFRNAPIEPEGLPANIGISVEKHWTGCAVNLLRK